MRWTPAGLLAAMALGLAACGGPTQVSGAAPIETTQSGNPDTPVTQPFADPASYKDKSWSFKPDAENGGSGAYLKVPQGWAETKRADYWSDFLDPTGQVRLRVDVTAGLTGDGLEVAPAKAAEDELARLKSAAGFTKLSRRALAPSGPAGAGYEIVYQFSRDGQTVQCTYRFVGEQGITEARMGVYYPAKEQQGAEKVLDAAQDSLRFAG